MLSSSLPNGDSPRIPRLSWNNRLPCYQRMEHEPKHRQCPLKHLAQRRYELLLPLSACYAPEYLLSVVAMARVHNCENSRITCSLLFALSVRLVPPTSLSQSSTLFANATIRHAFRPWTLDVPSNFLALHLFGRSDRPRTVTKPLNPRITLSQTPISMGLKVK